MCPPEPRYVRCVDAEAAYTWWRSPFLSPGVASQAEYVLQQREGRLGAGDGERAGSSVVVVLTFGGPTAHTGDTNAVLDAGGILLYGIRHADPGWEVTHSYPVRIRGYAGRVYEATSATDNSVKRRIITWDVPDRGSVLRWRVIDDGEHHTFKEVVAIVEALVET
jgi:hypothetical protein